MSPRTAFSTEKITIRQLCGPPAVDGTWGVIAPMQVHYLEIVTKDVDAEIAHPPMELPGHGTFAIYLQGGIHHGLWQR